MNLYVVVCGERSKRDGANLARVCHFESAISVESRVDGPWVGLSVDYFCGGRVHDCFILVAKLNENNTQAAAEWVGDRILRALRDPKLPSLLLEFDLDSLHLAIA